MDNMICFFKLSALLISHFYSINEECDSAYPLFSSNSYFTQKDKPDDHKKQFLKIKYINRDLDFATISGLLASVYM
jgi:hypothetical protein